MHLQPRNARECNQNWFRPFLHTSVDPLVLVASLISPNLSSSGVPGKPRQRIQQKIEHYHKFINIIWSFYCGFLPHKYYFISSSCPNWINKPWFGHDFLKVLFNFCTMCIVLFGLTYFHYHLLIFFKMYIKLPFASLYIYIMYGIIEIAYFMLISYLEPSAAIGNSHVIVRNLTFQ